MKLFAHKLLAGVHFGPDYKAEPDEAGKFPTKQFNRGDVLYDKEDLTLKEPARYGPVTGPRARETVEVVRETEVTDPVVEVPTGKPVKDESAYRAELEDMTVADLREHAKEAGVQLHGATTKADIVDAILKGDRADDGE